MGGKNGAVEFFRFIFCCVICIHHFKNYGNPEVFNGGYLGVDVFFVLSGFFLMQHYMSRRDADAKNPERSAFSYIRGRIARIFPHHLFSWVCMVLINIFVIKSMSLKTAVVDGWWELLLLKATGLGNNISVNGVSWYLSAMIGGSFLIYWLLCTGRKKRGNEDFYIYLLAPIIYLAVMQRFWENPGHLNKWVQSTFLFSFGFWRGFAEMGLGCTAFFVMTQLKKHVRLTPVIRVFMTISEIAGWSLILKHMWFGWNRKDFAIPIIAAFLIISSFLYDSYLSRILNNPVSIFLGKISFPMYLNQRIIQYPIRTLYPGHQFWRTTIIMMAILFAFSIVSQAVVSRVTSKFYTASLKNIGRENTENE